MVNGETLELPFNSNIADLVAYLGFQDQRIALEVNESIISKIKALNVFIEATTIKLK